MNVTFLYCERQVSRLIASGMILSKNRFNASVSFPVSQWIVPLLAKYGDEFVQDSHLLPFSPDTYVRHLTHRYIIVFSLTTVSLAQTLFPVKYSCNTTFFEISDISSLPASPCPFPYIVSKILGASL